MALPHGDRKLFDIEIESHPHLLQVENKEVLLRYVNDNVIGGDAKFVGPFGTRKGDCSCFHQIVYHVN